ncbi:hypothetical protein MRX96_027867 [Rhipicephalus microplus]
MEYQVDVESITPAEFEADSRWIRAVKAHSATAAHQPIDATFLDPDAEDFSTAEHHPYLANINYAAARTTDRVRINPCNNSLAVSTPSEPRARLYLHASELRLGTISYPPTSGPSPASSSKPQSSAAAPLTEPLPQELPAFSPPPPVYIPRCPVVQPPPLLLFPAPAQVI